MNYNKAMIENLTDAGCTTDFIEKFMTEWNKDSKNKGLRLLETHRRSLLETLHQAQRRIDCLDYLAYQLQKSEKESL